MYGRMMSRAISFAGARDFGGYLGVVPFHCGREIFLAAWGLGVGSP